MLGATGDLWRLHCAYDLLKSELAWAQVTDRSQGESLACIPIQVDDILVGDKVLATGTTSNGVFGTKIIWGFFEDCIDLLHDIAGY